MATIHASKDADPPGDTKLLWPRIAPCDTCGYEVLYARRTNYTVVKVEQWPVIVGKGPCPVCRSIPGIPCNACNDGIRGEEPSKRHVVITITGTVRPGHRLVRPWDSAYHRHQCNPTAH